jgi:hypothetical protein
MPITNHFECYSGAHIYSGTEGVSKIYTEAKFGIIWLKKELTYSNS